MYFWGVVVVLLPGTLSSRLIDSVVERQTHNQENRGVNPLAAVSELGQFCSQLSCLNKFLTYRLAGVRM